MENTAGSSSQQNYYQILGVPEDAEVQVIIKAHKMQIMKFHPDKAGSDPGNVERAQEINHARDVLIDKESREKYDKSLEARRAADAVEAEAARRAADAVEAEAARRAAEAAKAEAARRAADAVEAEAARRAAEAAKAKAARRAETAKAKAEKFWFYPVTEIELNNPDFTRGYKPEMLKEGEFLEADKVELMSKEDCGWSDIHQSGYKLKNISFGGEKQKGIVALLSYTNPGSSWGVGNDATRRAQEMLKQYVGQKSGVRINHNGEVSRIARSQSEISPLINFGKCAPSLGRCFGR